MWNSYNVTIHLVLKDDEDNYKQGKTLFEEKWDPNNSISLIDKDSIEEFLIYSKKFHFEQKPKPYLMFVRVLDEYFKDMSEEDIKYPKNITENYFENYKYQKDAIAKDTSNFLFI